MSKQETFNAIKRILDNPANEAKHLPAMESLINNFKTTYGSSKLQRSLEIRFLSVSILLNLGV